MWEETGAPRGNPRGHRRKVQTWIDFSGMLEVEGRPKITL